MTKAYRRIRVSAWACTCQRCGHDWTSTGDLPTACPGCKSRYWKTAAGEVPRGRPPKEKGARG